LLSLQARNAKERSTVTALEDVRARVRSMMLLYDKLCQFGAFDEISMGKYLPPLISEIVANFPGGASVRVVTDIDDFSLDVKKIQSIGILVNELLSNIMKHAFTGTMDGRVFVSAKIDGRHVVMVIKDNGVGMPDTFDFENSPGMGLLLVKGLVLQLAGSIRMERGKGTAFILEFDV
jgi:two-component sensor histidine kinase